MTEEASPLPAPPAPPAERFPFWGYADICLMAGLAGPCMIAGWGLVQLVVWAGHWHSNVPAAQAVPQMVIGYGLLFSALAVIFHIQYERPFWRSLGWIPTSLPFLWNVICGLGAALVVALIAGLLRTPEPSGPIVEMMKAPQGLALLAIFGTTAAPLAEELVFRGFLQPLLVRDLGAIVGIGLTSALFGSLHYWEYGDSWRSSVLVGLSGIGFGYMRYRTGSTRTATIMHASFNALSFISQFAHRG